jgi:predicted unusual protein kinase regulating ubiquinone biosynthesis (AarF/ABC1/UbiB family)
VKAKRVATMLALLSAATAGYLAVKRAGERRDDDRSGGPVSTATRAGRSLQLARMGTSAGAGLAVHKARRTFAAADRRDELDAEFQLRTAEQVADVLGNMKGALMKLGQMASYLDQGLPEPIREALSQLQADAPAMTAELAVETLEADLGRPLDDLFVEWEREPIAAASIGQVHRARLPDGRDVAVKVQYPGVDEAIKHDLDNAGLLIQVVGLVFPGLEPGPIVAELRARLFEELDYRNEAANQQLFVDAYHDHPFIHIPEVVHDCCGERVLTTELADGVRFDALKQWSQDERDLAAEAIYRFVFRSLWRLQAFNGDPHPGNYLFHPGGRVTFLDFGLVKRFQPGELQPLADMLVHAVVHPDRTEFRAAAHRSGFLQAGADVDDDALEGYFAHFYEFVQQDRVATITPAWSSESVRRYFDPSTEFAEVQRHLNVPASFVILQRINLGLLAVLGELNATRNWRRIAEELWPFVDGPPSTALGKEEAAWLAAGRNRR